LRIFADARLYRQCSLAIAEIEKINVILPEAEAGCHSRLNITPAVPIIPGLPRNGARKRLRIARMHDDVRDSR
jgi:hypothetical protein